MAYLRAEENRIVMLMRWTGITKELYEKAREQVNFEGDVPKGLVTHIATFDEKGAIVTDVWKSDGDLSSYVKNRLTPVIKELIDTEPGIEIYPLYNLFIPEHGEEEPRVVVLMNWEGVTKAIYEQAREQINFEGDVPKGLVVHIATFGEKGIRIVDIWESEKDFNNFARDRLMPMTGKLMIGAEPNIEVYPLHVLFIPGM